MLAMLPGYHINAENMERMMGVKERFDLGDRFQMSKGLARWRIVTMVFNMHQLQRQLPKSRKKFILQLDDVLMHYNALDYDQLSISQVVEHYETFENDLLLKWKAPLVNDFFAMIWFGLLEKGCKKSCPNEPNLHNDLLCGSQDIISTEPIHLCMEISHAIAGHASQKELFENADEQTIWNALNAPEHAELKAQIDHYISKFGDRCIGELKLESISYKQNPLQLISLLKAYVQQGVSQQRTTDQVEDQIRLKAEETIYKALKNKPLKHWWFKYILNKTRDLVSNRENLRFGRTRGFGMVRNMFSAIGNNLKNAQLIEQASDIFFLELDEIKSLKTAPFDVELRERIESRKAEFAAYKTQIPPQERFFTYGNDFSDEFIYSDEKMEAVKGDLKGIGCCPGIVERRVQVIHDPSEIKSLNGDILVTSSTDPGWVTLFPTTSGILVERGSLLSHSAIVSREMGIPCIVSISGLLRTLKTGDVVRMNGRTGEIQLISSSSTNPTL